MTSKSTPGVYVEEIVKFPPSVAQVATAIPAFIGFTQMAKKNEHDDLVHKPFRITSMLEYETYFGFPEKETKINVSVTDGVATASAPSDGDKSPFLMYYSMQMYFANGGGPCYIVSAGQYGAGMTDAVASVGLEGLVDGLNALEKADEPTLILFPDATSLPSDLDFHAIQNAGLMQCNKLQDRFSIIDTYRDSEYNNNDPIEAIRNGINLEKDYLKYGAAYYPFLDTILDYHYDENEVEVTGIQVALASLSQNAIDGIVEADLETYITELISLKDGIANAANDAEALNLKANARLVLSNIIKYLENNVIRINTLINKSASSADAGVIAARNALNTWMDSNLETTISSLLAKAYKLQQDDTQNKLTGSLTGNASNIFGILGIDEGNVSNSDIITTLTGQKTTDELFALDAAIVLAGGATNPTIADLKTIDNALYNQVKSQISLIPITLPPSSAMAGIYARVDSTRGVWKAPANVGVSYVVKPTVQISNEEQGTLNIHPTTGKSINAIRTFAGQGTLVWGARTLAGNDNEWRYVSVRRFFNMVEESVKKASNQFVFEPNDRNTWVRVKAMIDNFLTNQWKAGALAGPTPDKAFYVSVGLGETMTAQDVLEGYMNIEIGMAAVRPAEFIILKFSHKMQEA